MAISRRNFLKATAYTGFFSSALHYPSAAIASTGGLYVSAFTSHSGQHFVGAVNNKGELVFQQAVPSRGHSSSISSDGRYVAFFARRPRQWLVVIDTQTGEIKDQVRSVEERHFYGHGVFSKDNQWLFATENNYTTSEGVIGIYQVSPVLKRVGEIPSFGIGPHELVMLSDGKTIAVANGGIETHPDYGRRKLNLDTMSPRLTYIEWENARELAHYKPPHHQLSLRHLDINAADQIVVGAQYQGDPGDEWPLVFTSSIGKPLRPIEGQPTVKQRGLNQYIASVAYAVDGERVLTSSPKGDIVSLWDAKNSRWVSDYALPDIGGVCPLNQENAMILSSGNGTVYKLKMASGTIEKLNRHHKIHWDNHLRTS